MAQVNEYIRYEPGRAPSPLHRCWGWLSGRSVYHRAGGAQRDHYWPGGQPAGELPDLGRLRGAADQWKRARFCKRCGSGGIGAGHVLVMGTSGAFIAVCITALVQGWTVSDGEPDRGSSSLFQFALAARLSLFASDPHTDCLRHGDHADRRHGHADLLRLADGCAPRVRRRLLLRLRPARRSLLLWCWRCAPQGLGDCGHRSSVLRWVALWQLLWTVQHFSP